jgi:hypothetical protein
MRAKLTISAILLVSAASLSCGDGGEDLCMNCPGAVTTVFEGVIAGNDGVETGTLSLTLNDDGTGSGGFNVGGATIPLTSVGTAGTTLSASGGGYSFTGTVSGIFIDGSYTGGAAGGLVAAAAKTGQTNNLVQFCAAHDAGGGIAGIFAFVLNTTTNAVRGAWTSGTGVGAAFKGIISGFTGDDAGVMSGHTGTVTILPDIQNGTVGGFYDLDSGEAGSMSGPVCS